MRSFDPTIDQKTDAITFKERKEIKMAAEFKTLLNKFNIVAVQELQPTRNWKNAVKLPGSTNVKVVKKLVMNKKWYWSTTTPELGFAVDNDIYAKNCTDIDMSVVDDDARPSFMCEFYTEGSVRLLLIRHAHV